MDLDAAKHNLLEQFARIGRAVSSPSRLELLDLIAQGAKPVEMLARQTGLSVTNTSNHLKELRAAALVATHREGPRVHYRLADPAVYDLLRRVQEIARRRLGEVREIVRVYFEEPDALEPVRTSELLKRMRSGDAVALNVRPQDEYASGHIPGAVSIPLGELERRLSELPPDKEVVAYRQGPYCVLALRALEILRARGLRARRLESAMPDWRSRGLKVAAGEAR